MPETNPTWFRRRRRAVLAYCGSAVVLAAGLGFASLVQESRIAAQRSADT